MNCLNKDELINLNKLIRESNELQEIIVTKGMGRKYWNTIIPYAKSGRIQKVINYEYDFFKTCFFPGMSCMFYCGFAEEIKARYDPSKVMKSEQNDLRKYYLLCQKLYYPYRWS